MFLQGRDSFYAPRRVGMNPTLLTPLFGANSRRAAFRRSGGLPVFLQGRDELLAPHRVGMNPTLLTPLFGATPRRGCAALLGANPRRFT